MTPQASTKMLLYDSFVLQKKMSDQPDDSKTVLLRVRVSPRLYEYMTYLARHTFLGPAETDVARHVLTQRLDEMLHAGYHENRVPRDDE